ncbi:MAG: PilZ domain-containing protein [Nitrospirae bacterium]|nr:PilZ domain-containing protein [Nitrospirota bacterium]
MTDTARLKERSTSKRTPSGLNITLLGGGNIFYSGTVFDLSEKGMFIRTNKYFTPNSLLLIIIRLNNNPFQIIARVKQLKQANGDAGGIGVELLNAPKGYVAIVRGIKPDSRAPYGVKPTIYI